MIPKTIDRPKRCGESAQPDTCSSRRRVTQVVPNNQEVLVLPVQPLMHVLAPSCRTPHSISWTVVLTGGSSALECSLHETPPRLSASKATRKWVGMKRKSRGLGFIADLALDAKVG